MPKIAYVEKNFTASTLQVITQAQAIITEYQTQGYDLTLRQLYYQFVARDLLPNTQRNYKRLGSIIADARLAGYIDWNSIVDRTRNLYGHTHRESPEDAIHAAARSYLLDKWRDQPYRVEVWVEKEALAGVIGQAAKKRDCDYFPCRGYASESAMWRAACRLMNYQGDGQQVILLHLGDHDPSGIDMSRDIFDRLDLYHTGHGKMPPKVERIALNMDQVDEYGPPPNPAKVTDSRYKKYAETHGNESWELDALNPDTLENLIHSHIDKYIDWDIYYNKWELEQAEHRKQLRDVAQRWDDVQEHLTTTDDETE